MQQIAFLQTIHKLYDDRVFYHQTKSLEKYGFNVTIISLYSKKLILLSFITFSYSISI
jgi:hypothetical protein